jgi:hypothetical protein
MNDQFPDEIKSRGYWRINFRPLALPSPELTLVQAQEVVERSTVSLRGWDYPHIPRRTGDDTGIDHLENCVQNWVDWQDHREFWRMYTSSQFLHYRAIHEDWRERSRWAERPPTRWGRVLEGPVLAVLGNIWVIAEIFEFLARLVRSGLYADGVEVTVQLMNTRGRLLYIEETARTPFSYDRSTQAESITYQVTMSAMDTQDPKVQTATAVNYIFDRFHWIPNAEQLAKDIEELYQLRIGGG